MNILGVRIDTQNKKELDKFFSSALANNTQTAIFTPNPEILLDAYKDQVFRDVLNTSDLNLCDGMGIWLASRGKVTRMTGVDAVSTLCRVAAEQQGSVYLLGTGSTEIVEKAKTALEQQTGVTVCGIHPGVSLEYKEGSLLFDEDAHQSMMDAITRAAPDCVFVAFGQVKQELWIARYGNALPSVRVFIGVGGALDMYAGVDRYGTHVSRAPYFLRKIGLEWAWRLVMQPWRIKRIVRAVVFFPLMLVKEYFFSNRKNK